MLPLTSAPRKTLGRYELIRHLASGGMAEVLLARATGIEGFERHVVLKRIREAQARDVRFVEMFLDEARLAASLHHTNIAQVHDIGQDAGEYFFAMEYVHGEDLRKLLMHLAERGTMLPVEHIVTIVLSAAAALQYAHEHRSPDRKPLGIVHRDVSPANILVGYDGNVKVVDFGIAKASQRTTETQSGVMKGKVAYMSPEQCFGEPVDRRSDIFCLGIVLYELATVRRLFKAENDFLTMSAITLGAIPQPSSLRADLSPDLEAIILKALEGKPADRYQTADQMRVALEQYAAKAGLRTSTTALADYMRQEFGERPMPWLADDDEADAELTYDFDGSASGVVSAPSGFELPSGFGQGSPIVRARTNAITGAPPHTGELPPVRIDGPASHRVAARATSTTQPPATVPSMSASGPSRRRLWVAVASAVGLLLVIVLAASLAGGHRSVARTAPDPAAVQPVTLPAPAAKPRPIEKTVAHEPDPDPAVTSGVVVPVDPIAAKPKLVKPVPRKPVRGHWNPKSLFPSKR